MASANVRRRLTKSGISYSVLYRLGGREAKQVSAGTFATEAEAVEMRDWILERIAGGTFDRREAYVSPPTARPQLVYIAELGGLLKIGISADPERRCRDLHAVLLHVEDGGRKRERELHHKFRHLRVRGEFFRPGQGGEIRRYINQAKSAQEVRAVA